MDLCKSLFWLKCGYYINKYIRVMMKLAAALDYNWALLTCLRVPWQLQTEEQRESAALYFQSLENGFDLAMFTSKQSDYAPQG